MEKEIIVLIVIGVFALLTFVVTLMTTYKRYQKLIYVHTKTGNKYRIIQECLVKIDGTWKDAIVYVSEKNGEMYVREYNDFVLNFKRLSEWKKEEK
jgi:hypothetical protein